MVTTLKNKVLQGQLPVKEELLSLCDAPLEELCAAADEIRDYFCSNTFDLCTIINGKSGRCTEDCKYCAQSAFYHTCIEEYPLKSQEEILSLAKYNEARGVLRYSIVTSGRCLNDHEIDQVCDAIRVDQEGDPFGSVCLVRTPQQRSVSRAKKCRCHESSQ